MSYEPGKQLREGLWSSCDLTKVESEIIKAFLAEVKRRCDKSEWHSHMDPDAIEEVLKLYE